MAAMKCPLCGAARLADKRFCPACGHDYEAVLDQSASGAEPIATKPTIRFGAAAGNAAAHPNYWQRRSRRGKTGIVAISAVFALGLIGNLGSPPDADDTSPAGASVAADVAEATAEPTERPTPEATLRPTPEPTRRPTPSPTERPTPEPTPVPTPLLTPVPTPVPTPVATPIPPPPTAAPASACHASYQGGCLGVGIGDYDCAGGSGDGPHYIAGPIYVVGYDEFGLDRDGDGVGCES